jgi:hypothetical protein
VVVTLQILPEGDSPVLSGTHLPEQQSFCHLQTTPPSRQVGAAVGAAVGSSVGDQVSVQLLPVLDAASGLQLPLQHDDIHMHSSFAFLHVGVDSLDVVGSAAVGAVVGAAKGASVGAVGAAVALHILVVADSPVLSSTHMPEQH